MSSALETFRAQREIAEQVHARLTEVTELLRGVTGQMQAVARDDEFRKLLAEEQVWLTRSTQLVGELRRLRESEMAQFWPWVWRRWAMAMVLSAMTALGGVAGYVWAIRPQAAELAVAREQAAWASSLAQRVMKMTPAERKQFDALMK
jgi:hypothetical protein